MSISPRTTRSRGFDMKRLRVLGLVLLTSLWAPAIQAWQPGKDGPRVISTNTVFSALPEARVTTLAGPATAGSSTISVASAAGLSAGDVLMLYQAQGATLTSPDSAAFGAVSALNNAGRYELVNVFGVSGTTITLSPACGSTPLRFSYAAGAQVIRVPQYTSLTINAGVTLSVSPWNGSTGGVLPLIVRDTFSLQGTVSASAAGFRGGAVDNASQASGTNVTTFRSATDADGAEKGEGIGGYQAGYNALGGRYGRGAAANGGGGGNSHNAGGGGGGNGDSGIAWNGQGNPDPATTGAAAWAIDGSLTGATTSSGGGRGGYTYGSSDQNALTVAPGTAAWGGNLRRERGGLGGRPVPNQPSVLGDTRLFLGGGGGAGDGNNNGAGAGGNGGGLVLVVAGTLSGSGRIQSDGANGSNTSPAHNDSPGGGGAGGTIVVSATTASGVTLFARGGNGGNQLITSNESEGPGGGGGGGFVAAPATLVATVTGGVSGTSTSASVTEFPVNGATRGGAGRSITAPALASFPACPVPATITLGVTKTDGSATYRPGDAGTYTLVVTNTGSVPAVGTLVNDTLPNGLALSGPWTCVASAGGSCPASGGTAGTALVSLSGTVAGGGGTLTITVPVAYSADPTDY